MAIKLEDVRKFALSLPETTEEPHHNFGSFRVRGKIFVTLPPGGELLHIFLPDEKRELAMVLYPEFLEPVVWGSKVLGVRAHLPTARKAAVLDLVEQSHAYKSAQAGSRRSAASARKPRARGGDAA